MIYKKYKVILILFLITVGQLCVPTYSISEDYEKEIFDHIDLLNENDVVLIHFNYNTDVETLGYKIVSLIETILTKNLKIIFVSSNFLTDKWLGNLELLKKGEIMYGSDYVYLGVMDGTTSNLASFCEDIRSIFSSDNYENPLDWMLVTYYAEDIEDISLCILIGDKIDYIMNEVEVYGSYNAEIAIITESQYHAEVSPLYPTSIIGYTFYDPVKPVPSEIRNLVDSVYYLIMLTQTNLASLVILTDQFSAEVYEDNTLVMIFTLTKLIYPESGLVEGFLHGIAGIAADEMNWVKKAWEETVIEHGKSNIVANSMIPALVEYREELEQSLKYYTGITEVGPELLEYFEDIDNYLGDVLPDRYDREYTTLETMINAMEGDQLTQSIGLMLGKTGIYYILPKVATGTAVPYIWVAAVIGSTGYELIRNNRNLAIVVGKCEEYLKKDYDAAKDIVNYFKELLSKEMDFPKVQLKQTIISDQITIQFPPDISEEEVSMDLENTGSANSKVATYYSLKFRPNQDITCPPDQTAYCIRPITVSRLSENVSLARDGELSFTVEHDQVLQDWFTDIRELINEREIEELPITLTGEINILYGTEEGLIAAKTEQIDRIMYMRYKDGETTIFKQQNGRVEMPSGSYEVSLTTNSKVDDFKPLTPDLKTVIDVSGSSGEMGEMFVTVGKPFIKAINGEKNIHVTIDNEPAEFTIEEKKDTLEISLQYTHSTHSITIDYSQRNIPQLYIISLILAGVAVLLYFYLKKR